MNFSIIGTGFIMPRHAEAIYYVGGKIINIINTSHGEEKWREIVADKKTDCVVVLTPNDLHVKIAEEAAKNKKIVLCEKPLGISSAEVGAIKDFDKIFTILQLRHHGLVKEFKRDFKEGEEYEVEMDISVFRDKKYYESWKGKKERSGGVLFNLGIHYFDLLQYLFGEPEYYATELMNDIEGRGVIRGKNFTCKWHVSTGAARDKQRRVFNINGKDYNFSSQDNLSYENLHRVVYQELLQNRGISVREALKSIGMVEKLYSAALASGAA